MMIDDKVPEERDLSPETNPEDNADNIEERGSAIPDSANPGSVNSESMNTKPAIPSLKDWSDTMEDVIEEAMANGVFDNLPGQGKPLKLTKNPYNPGSELAFQLLKDNDYTLPWIAERSSIMKEIEAFRRELKRIWSRYQAEYKVAKSELVISSLQLHWKRHVEAWGEEIRRLNNKIAFANLKQPVEKLEIMTLSLESELKRAGAGKELG